MSDRNPEQDPDRQNWPDYDAEPQVNPDDPDSEQQEIGPEDVGSIPLDPKQPGQEADGEPEQLQPGQTIQQVVNPPQP